MAAGFPGNRTLTHKVRTPIDWAGYDPAGNYDDMIDGEGRPRPAARELAARLASLSPQELAERQHAAEQAIVSMGITFTVYSEGQNIDRAWPFDIVPRTLDRAEWSRIETGLKQRLRALNHFIADVYSEQRIVRDKIVPQDLLLSASTLRGPAKQSPCRPASSRIGAPESRVGHPPGAPAASARGRW